MKGTVFQITPMRDRNSERTEMNELARRVLANDRERFLAARKAGTGTHWNQRLSEQRRQKRKAQSRELTAKS